MASSGSGYDLSSSTFSPDGRLFQVEYATKAVEQAGTVIGIACQDGAVVLGVSKPILHKMVVPTTGSYKRIHHVHERAGVASTGFLPDARVLVSRAMDEASDWKAQYGTSIPPDTLAARLGSYVHYFTLHGALRPFGAAAVLASYDEEEKAACLHLVEPSGNSHAYFGVAVGKGKQAAKTELEKLNLHKTKLSPTQAVQEICKILILLHQENKESSKPLELEVSWLTKENDFRHVGVPLEMIQQAKEWAQTQLEQEESDAEEEEETMEEG
jgi:20S proteasome subunit alpha 7